MSIPIYKPMLSAKSLAYAHSAIDSGWLGSNGGEFIQKATEKLQELLKVKHVLLLNNGTSACHLAALALYKKINKPGKQHILCGNNCYVASANSLLFDQNFILHPIKTDLNNWNLDLQDLDITLKQFPDSALQITHNISSSINVAELQRKYPRLLIIEDACEGLLGSYEGQYNGTGSLCGALSFYPNKTICCGEGGAFLSNSTELYQYVKTIHAQGQSQQRFVHCELGFNMRMTNISSAILMGQLELLPEILDRKNAIFERYRNVLKDREDVVLQAQPENTTSSNWMFGIRIPKQQNYQNAEKFFGDRGIEIRQMFYSLDAHSHLRSRSDIDHIDDPNAEELNRSCIILPSYPELTEDEQNYVLETLEEYLKSLK